MIYLDGYKVEFFLASGSRGFDGKGYRWKFWETILEGLGLIDPSLFVSVLKSISAKSHIGNRPFRKAVKLISENGRVVSPLRALVQPKSIAGTVNAIGLDNPGFMYWLNEIYPEIVKRKLKVIFSAVMIGREREDEFLGMIYRLNELKNILAIEFNPSCPNNPHLLDNPDKVVSFTSVISQTSRYPLILKLGYGQDYCGIARRTEEFIRAFSINAVPWSMVDFPDVISPLAEFGGGGVSGKAAQKYTWKMIKELVAITSRPVIAPSIWDSGDIEKVYELGASAISFGAVGLPFAWRPTKFAREWMKNKGGRDDC